MKPEQKKSAPQPQPKTSLAAAFARAARRRFSTVLLSAALISSGCASQLATTSPAQAALPPADAVTNVQGIAPPRPDTLSEKQRDRHAFISAVLINDARERYPELADSAATDYSKKLKVVQDSLSRYLAGGQVKMHSAIVIMDPAKIDVAVALSVPVRAAIEYELVKKGAQPGKNAAQTGARQALTPFKAESGVTTYTQNPSAFPNFLNEEEAQPCLIIPVSDHSAPFDIPGLSHTQKLEMINTHEGWHCLDTHYRMTQTQIDALASGDANDLEQILTSPLLLSAASTVHHKETLADVAALGDMVRHGQDTSLIDRIIDWRTSHAQGDYLHYSSPALAALKEKISEMGTEAFRKLSFDDARDLYFAITDAEALSPTRLQVMALYVMGDSTVRSMLQESAAEEPDIARGLAYAEQMVKPAAAPQPLKDIIAAFAPPDQELRQKLLAWRPLDVLEKTAMEKGGKITPETLIRAYGSLQNELHRDLSGSEERLAREKMTLLKGIFTRYVRSVDYVAVNARYGVDIEQAESTLISQYEQVQKQAQLQIQVQPAAAPAAPSGPPRR